MKVGIILSITASIIKGVIQPFAWTWGTIESIIRGEHDQWELDKAYAKDVFGCVLIKYPANWILIKKNGYKFGQKGDSISKVLGKNKELDTLTYLGRSLAFRLNKWDENHVEEASK